MKEGTGSKESLKLMSFLLKSVWKLTQFQHGVERSAPALLSSLFHKPPSLPLPRRISDLDLKQLPTTSISPSLLQGSPEHIHALQQGAPLFALGPCACASGSSFHQPQPWPPLSKASLWFPCYFHL